jgi:hypothetical protein
MLTPKPEVLKSVTRYINAIRSASKKQYAGDYWEFLTGSRTDEPKPECSEMASEAVRNRLRGILRRAEEKLNQ